MIHFSDFDTLAANLPLIESGPYQVPPPGFRKALTTLQRLEAVAYVDRRAAYAVAYAYVYAGETLRKCWNVYSSVYEQTGKMLCKDVTLSSKAAQQLGWSVLNKGLSLYSQAKPDDLKITGSIGRILLTF